MESQPDLDEQQKGVEHIAPYKNKAHRSAFAAGWRAAKDGKERHAPYDAFSRTSSYFRSAWLAGYDSGTGNPGQDAEPTNTTDDQ